MCLWCVHVCAGACTHIHTQSFVMKNNLFGTRFLQNSGSHTLICSTSRIFDLVFLGWGPKICISNMMVPMLLVSELLFENCYDERMNRAHQNFMWPMKRHKSMTKLKFVTFYWLREICQTQIHFGLESTSYHNLNFKFWWKLKYFQSVQLWWQLCIHTNAYAIYS